MVDEAFIIYRKKPFQFLVLVQQLYNSLGQYKRDFISFVPIK